MAAAMKDVINAAAGLTAFALESARELVQYMVRRGQMTQDEADKLMRDVESSHGKRHSDAKRTASKAKAQAAPAAKQEKAPKLAAKSAAPSAKPKAKTAPKAAAKSAAKKSTKKR